MLQVPERAPILQFGAGAIGRGFLGQLWSEAGYRTVFVDANPAIVGELQTSGAYPLFLVSGKKPRMIWVSNIAALGAADVPTIAWYLRRCEFACTAVGASVFPRLAPTLAAGIAERAASRYGEDRPLNILCCENQKDAARLLRAAVAAVLPEDPAVHAYFEGSVAFVDASVGRMVPPPTPATTIVHPLAVDAEPYRELPIDVDAWLGPIPPVPGLLPKENFRAYVARKLYTHNGGHAYLAYLGYRAGYDFIWQAAEDDAIVAAVKGFWAETGKALVRAYGFKTTEQRAHENDLLRRFRNPPLADPIARVARDVVRKLRPGDRLVGAAEFCQEQGIKPVHTCRAIAAALAYDAPDDPSAPEMQSVIAAQGLRAALDRFAGLAPDSPLVPRIEAEYATMVAGKS